MNTRPFRTFASRRAATRLAVVALLAALTAPVIAADVPVTDGLVPTKVKYFDKAWQKPGASFGNYTSVLLRPVTVTFSSNWRPRDYGLNGLKDKDVERIRAMYAKAGDEAFARVLSKGGYRIATAPGGDVLDVQVEVVDLYVNAPDDEDVFSRTYVRTAGELRVLITLRDSAAGTVLFHGSDFSHGQETGGLQWANALYNRTEAERAFTDWARQLRGFLGK